LFVSSFALDLLLVKIEKQTPVISGSFENPTAPTWSVNSNPPKVFYAVGAERSQLFSAVDDRLSRLGVIPRDPLIGNAHNIATSPLGDMVAVSGKTGWGIYKLSGEEKDSGVTRLYGTSRGFQVHGIAWQRYARLHKRQSYAVDMEREGSSSSNTCD
jgi:hypothetical protein